MGHAFAEQRFGSYEDVKNGSMNGSQQKRKIFSCVVFTNFPEDGKMYNKQCIKQFLSLFRI